jgi:hypothetical protein
MYCKKQQLNVEHNTLHKSYGENNKSKQSPDTEGNKLQNISNGWKRITFLWGRELKIFTVLLYPDQQCFLSSGHQASFPEHKVIWSVKMASTKVKSMQSSYTYPNVPPWQDILGQE